jgi:dTDP-glucose pyrophosphorylase
MLNIVVPIAGDNQYFENSKVPKPLVEVMGKPMIQLAIENLQMITEEKRFIFVLRQEDCKKYYLDDIVKILTNNECEIVRLEGPTQGAACSCLMASEYINHLEPIIISNSDQVFRTDINEAISSFKTLGASAGVITFDAVHPRWSYVRVNEKDQVVEFAEKRPISRSAIAGFYYFQEGSKFVSSAMKMISKGANVEGLYYIAPVLNELILDGDLVCRFPIDSSQYKSFYTPMRVESYDKGDQFLNQSLDF